MTGPLPEAQSRLELRQLQSVKLRQLIAAVLPGNRFWSRRFAAAGVKPHDVWTPDDLAKLPPVSKQALIEDQVAEPPYGTNLSEPAAKFSRLHQTSGTTGAPLRWLDTPASWSWVVSCWEQIYRICGITADDVVAFPFSFGPFLGFWAAFEGACRLGALCLPAGGLTSQARLQMLIDNRATVVCCTPTYALRLAEIAKEERLDLARCAVRALIVAGEPGGNVAAVRQRIEQAWGARVFDHWGMTELGPLGIECRENPGGMHLLESECIAEVVDPASRQPAAPDTPGELIVTNLGRFGSPLFRYRTGDLVMIDPQPCPCGRALVRLKGGILGRIDDMFTIRGNNVFPASIEAIVRKFDEIVEYRIDVETRRSMKHVKITIEPRRGADPGRLVSQLARAIRDTLHFQAEVAAVAPGDLPRFELKAQRFFHQR